MSQWHDVATPVETELLVGFYDLTGFMRETSIHAACST
jgi:hypothetical protein